MIDGLPWYDRDFVAGMPAGLFPAVVERLRGTPARLEERVRGLSHERLETRYDGHWSIQENVGHLLDLEPLWAGRLDDLLTGADTLRPGDVDNLRTRSAGHNARLVGDLLRLFRAQRASLVGRLYRLPERLLAHTCMHPRLRRSFNVVDVFHLAAEHDDHHLARIGRILAEADSAGRGPVRGGS